MRQEDCTEMPFKKKYLKNFILLIDLIFISFCAGISSFYLFIGNIKEMYFTEILLSVLIFLTIGWLLYLILRLFFRHSPRKAAVLSGIAMVIITNIGSLRDAIGYAGILIISAVSIAAIFFVIIRFAKEGITGKIEFIVTGVMAALILFNIVISLPQFDENKRLSEGAAAKAASLEKIEVPEKYASGNEPLPNFYLFFFDELAGTQCMKEVFDYDNTWFYDDMRALGFNVLDKSTNHREFTFECFAGMFNMDYVFSYDEDGALACHEQFKNARFFSLMREMGYGMYETETTGKLDFEPRFDYGASKEYSKAEDGDTTFDILLDNSLFGPFVKALGIFPSDHELFKKIFDYYKDPASYTYKNALTFSMMACPHAPFIFDKNGEPVGEVNKMNWADKKYFLEQYEYICGRIVDTMESVIANDPDAIIIVFSDHGVKGNKALWNGPSTTYEQATDTFFAVYTGGRDELGNLNGLSGANVLRAVLNKEFGFNLEMVGAPAE